MESLITDTPPGLPPGWVNDGIEFGSISSKWYKDESAGSFRYCPHCAQPLITPEFVLGQPRCSHCEREYPFCGCCFCEECVSLPGK